MEKAFTFELVLHQRIGPVQLGMRREALRATLPERVYAQESHIEEELGGMLANASDYFEDSGVKVEYDSDDRVVFIEVGNLVPLLYQNISLFELTFMQVYSMFRAIDPEMRLDESGATSYKLQIALYAPQYVQKDDCTVELLSIFSDTYYSD